MTFYFHVGGDTEYSLALFSQPHTFMLRHHFSAWNLEANMRALARHGNTAPRQKRRLTQCMKHSAQETEVKMHL